MSSLSRLIDRLVSFEDESQRAAFHRLLKQRLAFVPVMALVVCAGALREFSGPEPLMAPLMAVQVANTLATYLPAVLFTCERDSGARIEDTGVALALVALEVVGACCFIVQDIPFLVARVSGAGLSL